MSERKDEETAKKKNLSSLLLPSQTVSPFVPKAISASSAVLALMSIS